MAGPAGTGNDLSGERASHFAVCDDRSAVYENVVHADGKLVGLIEGGHVVNGFGVENDYVGAHTYFEHAAIGEPHALRRKRAKFAYGVGQSEKFFFAHVFGKNAWKGAVGTGMRMLFAEDAFG